MAAPERDVASALLAEVVALRGKVERMEQAVVSAIGVLLTEGAR